MLKQGLLLLVIVALLFLDEIVPLPPGPEPGLPRPLPGQVVANSEAPKNIKTTPPPAVAIPGNTNGEPAPPREKTIGRKPATPNRDNRQPVQVEAPPRQETAARPSLASDDGVNFLLLGHRDSKIELLIIVSLIPGKSARLLAIQPGTILQDGATIDPLDRAARWRVSKRLEEVAGGEIQFAIGLDLARVSKMIDTMGGVKYMLEADSRRESSIGGDRALELLIRDLIPAGEKEQLLRALLLQIDALKLTKISWTLIKMGYYSLSTDLTIPDLLELRKVSHSISPYRLKYRELP